MSEPDANGWRPIETAPKDGRNVLLVIPNSGIPFVGYWNRRLGWRVTWDGTLIDGNLYEAPTHWQGIPLPPEVTHE